MEHQDGEVAEKENTELTVDLSKQALKRIERANAEKQSAKTLILDHNDIQKLDSLETYTNLKKLSIANNQLIRMYGVCHLYHLVSLDLSNNLLNNIEGLKELKELKYLKLAKNRIKIIDHLNRNLKLEYIDLSENNIMRISDISFLKNLKELRLHGNRISHLILCDKYLPDSLEVLAINENALTDLNEISYLANLPLLRELSILNNPCLDFPEDQKFNYRPFVKNWCSSLIILDNSPLDDIECLKAEWMYSQGRGRSFKPGEHAALVEYLFSVCPREKGENSENEDVKKLKLILSKAHLHQQQLREQISTGKVSSGDIKSSVTRKKGSVGSERMVTSFQDSPSVSKDIKQNSELMSRSLDLGVLRKSSKTHKPELSQTPLQTSTTFIPIPDTLISPDVNLPAASSYTAGSLVSSHTSRSSSRNSQHSTPESKRKVLSPAFKIRCENSSPVNLKTYGKLNSIPSTPLQFAKSPKILSSRVVSSPIRKGSRSGESDRNCRETSEDEDSELLALKVKTVQQRITQRWQRKIHSPGKTNENVKEKQTERKVDNSAVNLTDSEAWKAAVCIQRRWRGYRARNLNGEVLTGCQNIQINRMQDYITKVVRDMEATRIALEGNRKLVVLQMQAINSLWKRMMTLQPNVELSSADSKVSIQCLLETCSNLNKQVEGLQKMMKAMQGSSSSDLIPIATQTEIVAVHTPQCEKESFPYNPNLKPNDLTIEFVENKGKNFGNDSNSSVLEDVTQLYMKESTNEDNISLVGFLEPPFQSEALSKPEVKLNKTNNDEESSPAVKNTEEKEQSEESTPAVENAEEEEQHEESNAGSS